MKSKYTNFCVRLNEADKAVLRELKRRFAFNVSGHFKLYIREQLRKLGELE